MKNIATRAHIEGAQMAQDLFHGDEAGAKDTAEGTTNMLKYVGFAVAAAVVIGGGIAVLTGGFTQFASDNATPPDTLPTS